MRATVIAAALAGANAVVQDPMARRTEAMGNDVRQIAFEPYELSVDYWNAEAKQYETRGTVTSKYFIEATDPSLHAANVYAPRDFRPTPDGFPRSWYGATSQNKYYEVSDLSYDKLLSNETSTVDVTLFAYGMAPSGMKNVEDPSGRLTGWLLGGGNPVGIAGNVDPETGERFTHAGSVAFLPNSDESVGEYSPMLFPSPEINDLEDPGTVINTMICHQESGLCVFTEHRFYVGTAFAPEDCLYWCEPNDINNPTECVASGKMTYPDGSNMCSIRMVPDTHYGGGVHSLALGKTDASNPDRFQLILLYTGGVDFNEGVSHLEEVFVEYDRVGAPQTFDRKDWGAQLWDDTVVLPQDVGLDHCWVDPSQQHVWISSFREGNNGFHMLDLDTGDLVLSLHGFEDVRPGQYTYPAGSGGYGSIGEDGSFVLVPTSGVVFYVPVNDLPGYSN
jgi:hypothetical protein